MKNLKYFNRRSSPHGHHGSKHRELAQHAHSLGLRAFTHAQFYINTVATTWCEAPAQLLQNLESREPEVRVTLPKFTEQMFTVGMIRMPCLGLSVCVCGLNNGSLNNPPPPTPPSRFRPVQGKPRWSSQL